METVTLTIEGMKCDGCAERIHGLLVKELGVRQALVSFPEGCATITFNPLSTTEANLRNVIERAGFTPTGG